MTLNDDERERLERELAKTKMWLEETQAKERGALRHLNELHDLEPDTRVRELKKSLPSEVHFWGKEVERLQAEVKGLEQRLTQEEKFPWGDPIRWEILNSLEEAAKPVNEDAIKAGVKRRQQLVGDDRVHGAPWALRGDACVNALTGDLYEITDAGREEHAAQPG